MLQRYQNRLNMWKVCRDYLLKTNAAWKSSAPMNNYNASLNQNIDAAEAALLGQAGTSTGISQDKDALEETAVAMVVSIAESAAAYAHDNNNNTLLAAVDYGKHALLHLTMEELPAKLRSIVYAAKDVSGALKDYEVDVADYGNALAATDAFEKATPTPRSAIAGKSVATQSIPATMKSGGIALGQIDRMAKKFDKNLSGFSAGWKAARVVVDAGQRHDKPAPATP